MTTAIRVSYEVIRELFQVARGLNGMTCAPLRHFASELNDLQAAEADLTQDRGAPRCLQAVEFTADCALVQR